MSVNRSLFWPAVFVCTLAGGCAAHKLRGNLASTGSAPATTQPSEGVGSDRRVGDKDVSALRASLVTLHFRKVPAADVYRSLFDQAGAKLATWPSDLLVEGGRSAESFPPVTIDVDRVPFWEAFRELEKQTALNFDARGEMQLSSGHDANAGQASVHGPYLVVPEDSFGPWVQRMNVFVEPRIKLLAHAEDADVTEAIDLSGDPLPLPPTDRPARGRDRRELRETAFGSNAFTVSLPAPIPRSARFRGTVEAVVQTEEEKLEIKDFSSAKPADEVVDGERYQVSLLKLSSGEWEILLTVFGVSNADRSALDPRAVDADGNEIKLRAGATMSFGGRLDVSLRCPLRSERGRWVKLKLFRNGHDIEIPLAPAKEAERSAGGRRYLLDVRCPLLGQYLVTVIANDADPAKVKPTDLKPELIDAKGHALESGEMVGGGGAVRICFRQGAGCEAPAKLLLPTSKNEREIAIPFEFGYAK